MQWSERKKFVDVGGRRMAYVESGTGRPVVFLHGNPTSSYLWRNVMPWLEGCGRLIAPDLMGMGDSEKLPHGTRNRYRFASQGWYLDGFLREVCADQDVVLVLHDWGGALGFDWANRNRRSVSGVAYMETFVCPLALADLPESFHPTLRAVRSNEGDKLVLDENMFIEQMLPGLVQRPLTDDEMREYRRPFLLAGDGRMATLQWPREVPLEDGPHDVAERIAAYADWLRHCDLPKLLIDADPGVFITGRVRSECLSWPNQSVARVKGLHFLQEDSADDVGRALREWIGKLPVRP
jgi:haloalkane dehalogenase